MSSKWPNVYIHETGHILGRQKWIMNNFKLIRITNKSSDSQCFPKIILLPPSAPPSGFNRLYKGGLYTVLYWCIVMLVMHSRASMKKYAIFVLNRMYFLVFFPKPVQLKKGSWWSVHIAGGVLTVRGNTVGEVLPGCEVVVILGIVLSILSFVLSITRTMLVWTLLSITKTISYLCIKYTNDVYELVSLRCCTVLFKQTLPQFIVF